MDRASTPGISQTNKTKKSVRKTKIIPKKQPSKEPEILQDQFDYTEADFLPFLRDDSEDDSSSQRIRYSATNSLKPSPNSQETRQINELSMSELLSPNSSQRNQVLVNPMKRNNVAAFAYVLENQLNDHTLANSQANTIIQDLISNALACHRKLALNLPGGVSREVIKSPRKSEMKEAHDIVKKLLQFYDIFDQIVYDIRLLQQSIQYHMNQNVRMKEEADREVSALKPSLH